MSTCTHATNSAANEDVLRGRARQHHDEVQRRVHDVLRTHHTDRGDGHRHREDVERHRLRDRHPENRRHHHQRLASAPISSGSGSVTPSIHSPSFCLSWSSLEMLHSEYSYSGLQNSASNGTDLDADPAVHAERVVDVEAVEHAHAALATTLTARRALLLVALDVDAPVGALARAQHADRAVLLLERDHATRARGRVFALVRVLHGDRGLEHRLERDAQPADQPGELRSFCIRKRP